MSNVLDGLRELRQAEHRHWHFVYRHRRQLNNVSTRQIIGGQIFALFASALAGLVLDINKDSIALLVGAILMMPGIVDLSASIGGALCAKIHHNIESTQASTNVVVLHALTFAMLVAIFGGLVVGLFGGAIGAIFFDTVFWKMCVLSVVVMTGVGAIGFPIMATITLIARRAGLNPDNLVGPIESSLFDVLTIFFIAGVVGVLA